MGKTSTSTRRAQRAKTASDRVPLAILKSNFSRYVREVQTRGTPITITQHGRDAAVLAPVVTQERPLLVVREPLDPRPLGTRELRPRPGRGVRSEAIQRALDEERGE